MASLRCTELILSHSSRSVIVRTHGRIYPQILLTGRNLNVWPPLNTRRVARITDPFGLAVIAKSWHFNDRLHTSMSSRQSLISVNDRLKTILPAEPATRKTLIIAVFALVCIAVHLALRWTVTSPILAGQLPSAWPLILGLILGGIPLVWDLLKQAFAGEFGSDLLAGLAMVTALLQGEYLAGVFVVLMLSGGQALEAYAVRSASSVLDALAKRLPQTAHRRLADEKITDIALGEVAVGDTLVIFPHEICPVDGTVVEGHGSMDESYLTGEPYLMPKAPGSSVFSGAINGNAVLVIHADRLAVDSRYAKIMNVMRAAEQRKPRMRRLADRLGAFYTPLAVAIAVLRVDVERRVAAIPGSPGRRNSVSAADRNSCGDSRRHFTQRPTRNHYSRSRCAGTYRSVPGCHL